MVFKLTNRELFFYFIVITPVVDTINGWILWTFGATGISLGTFYRALLLLILFSYIIREKHKFVYFALLLYFPFLAMIKGVYDGALIAYLTYAIKWIFPIMLIMAIAVLFRKNRTEKQKMLERIFDIWAILMPALLIIEYSLKLGAQTYYDAGFKGYFYSTNDIAFSLMILFIYAFYSLIYQGRKRYFAAVILNFVAIIILGTKSCFLFMVITVVYYLVQYLIRTKRVGATIISVVLMILLSMVGMHLFAKEINDVINRYGNMWNYSMGRLDRILNSKVFMERIFSFLTSARTDRIQSFFGAAKESGSILYNYFFGWIVPDNATVIEMDWHDLICQYGIIGFVILVSFYIRLALNCRRAEKMYGYLFCIGIIYTTFSGHIISGALAGTVFGIVCSLIDGSLENKGD